jgi:phage terminase small subunit
MTSLNHRRERFARCVAAGKTHRQAALEAGYSPHSAGCLGAQLIRFRSIDERIRQLRQDRRRAELHSKIIKAKLDVPETIEPTTLFDTNGLAVGVFVPISKEDQKSR